jgi:protein ImuB
LDVTGVAHLFGGEAGLLAQIQRHFDQRGYTACAVLADTIGTAWGLAKFGGGRTEFEQLPIEALRLSPAIAETLRQLGVERVSQVLKLPRADLHARFGDEIHRRLDQASGVRDEVLEWVPPPVEFYAQRFLDFPTTDAATIQLILSQLVEQLCQQMRARQRGGLQWQCRLYSPDREPLRIDVSLFHPAAEASHVMPLVRMQLEQQGLAATRGRTPRVRQVFDGAFAVHHVSLSVTQSVVLVDRQRLLFDENPRLDKQDLAHLINRLSARLGAERVLGAGLVAEAQPELACRLEPLVGRAAVRRGSKSAARGGSPLQRPLRLHTPQAIEIVSAGAGSPPAQVIIGGDRWRAVGCWGPERIETGWWRGPSVRRDYWRVELEDGRWLWLFCDLRSRQWFCQGAF